MDASRFDRLTRRLAGRTTRRAAVGTALAGLGLAGIDRLAAGQDATPAPVASPASEGEKPVFMFVQTFASGRGEANPNAGTPTVHGPTPPGGAASLLLTLEGHTGQTIYFSDRPDRIVGATPTAPFLDGLGFVPTNPPNAALVGEFAAGQGVVVLELVDPVYTPETGTLVYGAEVLEAYEGDTLTPVLAEQVAARLPAEVGPTALFIDDCPAYTSCYHDDEQNDYAIPVYVGPIPGGPYEQCYDAAGGCSPCDYVFGGSAFRIDLSKYELDQLCRDSYDLYQGYAWY